MMLAEAFRRGATSLPEAAEMIAQAQSVPGGLLGFEQGAAGGLSGVGLEMFYQSQLGAVQGRAMAQEGEGALSVWEGPAARMARIAPHLKGALAEREIKMGGWERWSQELTKSSDALVTLTARTKSLSDMLYGIGKFAESILSILPGINSSPGE